MGNSQLGEGIEVPPVTLTDEDFFRGSVVFIVSYSQLKVKLHPGFGIDITRNVVVADMPKIDDSDEAEVVKNSLIKLAGGQEIIALLGPFKGVDTARVFVKVPNGANLTDGPVVQYKDKKWLDIGMYFTNLRIAGSLNPEHIRRHMFEMRRGR